MNATQQITAIIIAVLGWIADRWFTHRKIEKNQRAQMAAARRAYLMHLAPMAWAKTEAWKHNQREKPSREILWDHFFRELNDQLSAGRRVLLTEEEREEWAAWATLKTDAEHAMGTGTCPVRRTTGPIPRE